MTAGPTQAQEADISHERLARVFNPRSIAVVGVREGPGGWLGSGAVVDTLRRLRYTGELHLVSRSTDTAYGQKTYGSLKEVGRPIDHVAAAVSASALVGLIDEMAQTGAPAVTSLASGFAEMGIKGRELQEAVTATATDSRISLLGPNCLGFVNLAGRSGVWFAGIPANITPGPVAIVSQSGGIGEAAMDFAASMGIGISQVITTGNEAALTVTDIVGYLVEDPATQAIAVFAEGLKKPAAFLRIAERARELGKAIVILKIGRSELGARNAISHTGSLVGEDRVVESVLRQAGVIRVASLEELMVTAHTIAHVGRVPAPGVAVLSMSGGSCSLFADLGQAAGVSYPEFDHETKAGLTDLVEDFATVQNPFDVTGASDESAFEAVIETASRQPDIGIIAVQSNVPSYESGAADFARSRLASIARGIERSAVPAVLVAQTSGHWNSFAQKIVGEAGVAVTLPGIQLATVALGHLAVWSAALDRTRPVGEIHSTRPGETTALSEWDSRQLLESYRVPLVPAKLATSPQEALKFAREFGTKVAVKVAADDLPHKSDAGAVLLNVPAEDAAQAFHEVFGAGKRSGATCRGAIISPMRPDGVELIAGVTRDPIWGLVLMIGMGGVLVELANDSAVLGLPVTREEIEEALSGLRCAALLRGFRGQRPVDWQATVDSIYTLALAADRIGDRLEAVELNPLLATTEGCDALDALVILRSISDG